jgi:hypothetical protein
MWSLFLNPLFIGLELSFGDGELHSGFLEEEGKTQFLERFLVFLDLLDRFRDPPVSFCFLPFLLLLPLFGEKISLSLD